MKNVLMLLFGFFIALGAVNAVPRDLKESKFEIHQVVKAQVFEVNIDVKAEIPFYSRDFIMGDAWHKPIMTLHTQEDNLNEFVKPFVVPLKEGSTCSGYRQISQPPTRNTK